MSIERKIIFWPVFLVACAMPYLFVVSFHPSPIDIEQKGSIRVGTVETKSGNKVDIFVMLGDVFAPKYTRRDIGFDLVAVSCYFDPIEISGRQVLITNPLLNSALLNSARDSLEFVYFISNLFASLEQSKEVVTCFLRNKDKSEICEGDKLTPYVWLAYKNSPMFLNQGVKYIATLPLFDPSLYVSQFDEGDLRMRLAINVETAVRRLIGYSLDSLKPTVKSIGLATLGSTSHRGGDSQAFLNFDKGLLTILQGIKSSHTTESLDRIYLVGFNKHEGVFRTEVIRGLQSVADYLILELCATPSGAVVTGAIYSLLWLLISLLLYQNLGQIWRQKNRWNLLAVILGPNTFLVALNTATLVALTGTLHPSDYKIIYWANAASVIIGTIILANASKRFKARGTLSYKFRQTAHNTHKNEP